MAVQLFDHQLKAVNNLRNGSVLVGGVGSGKSRTALGYYFVKNGGAFEPYSDMRKPAMDLYIITTAKKRDTLEWEEELAVYSMSTAPEVNPYGNRIVIDSWNNIKKYENVRDAFFIFDEQRVVGSGAWVKSFIKIARANNQWILLSATPGDTWIDYAPLFIANGFYKNITEFRRRHVVFSRYAKFPKIERYVDVDRLIECRKRILVIMEFKKQATKKREIIKVEYNRELYEFASKKHWNVFTEEPCQTPSTMCQVLRKIVNTDPSRQNQVLLYFEQHPKLIVFYNYDYELEILRTLCIKHNITWGECNGHRHDDVPKGESWMYLVQYNSGSEGWNCITTNSILFYSDTYSYRMMVQASGRIDRLNTPYSELYYAYLRSSSSIDVAIANCLSRKKKFNEKSFVEGW